MKKFLAMFTMIMVGVVSVFGMEGFSGDEEKVVINIDKEKKNWETEKGRSLDNATIEACAYLNMGEVAVSLHNIGVASVRLLNANNQVVCAEIVQTDVPTVIYLDASSSGGTFYLEIESDTWYAKGVVTF
ncbi:MAG: hypothetical protein IKT92_05080 [Bacteroidaceae bacterium]|nr:hypothetical protein [Bacteroidaceae bacterium]